jgi:hypothetical protein
MTDHRARRITWRVALAAAAIGATGLLTAAPAVATTASPAVSAQTASQTADGYRYENWYFTYARCHQAGREGKDLGRWSKWKCVANSWNTAVELWVK